MNIAVISDVHSNATALEAVLADMLPVDRIVCLGDTIGYGPHPLRAAELVKEHADIVLGGNHEQYLESPSLCAGNKMAYEGIQHSRKQLSSELHDWLTSLPNTRSLFDETLLATHGYPSEENPFQYIRPRNVTELIPFLRELPESVLTAGHLHVQFKNDLTRFHEEAGLFFNPGSVGQPRDKDPTAAYAVLDLDTETVSLNRVEYNVAQVIEDINAAGLPDDTGNRLQNGVLNRDRRL